MSSTDTVRFALMVTITSLFALWFTWVCGEVDNGVVHSPFSGTPVGGAKSRLFRHKRLLPYHKNSGYNPLNESENKQDLRVKGLELSARRARRSVQWELCGPEGKCRCLGSSVDCSRTYLDFIPSFHQNVTQLNFSLNLKRTIKRSDFFQNVTGIRHLDLSRNFIEYVHLDAFRTLRKLRILKFSNNKLKFRSRVPENSLQPILQIQTLEVLFLEGNDFMDTNLGPVPSSLFYDYPMRLLRALYLDGNVLGKLNLSAFKPLQNLRELHVNTASIREIQSDFLPSLVSLSARHNDLKTTSFVCRQDDGRRYFPNLKNLNLAFNNIRHLAEDGCTQKLVITNISLEGNIFIRLNSGDFAKHPYRELRFLNLKNALDKHCTIESRAFLSSSLKILDLSSNRVDFASDVPSDAFVGSSSLSTLRLEDNLFRHISEETFELVMSGLWSLKALKLADTHLDKISRRMVKPLKNIQKLDVSRNMLRVVPDGTFDDLELLNVLRLDSNLISTVSEKTFSAAMRSRLKSLNLSNNPFECTCSLLWFRHWLQTSPALFDYPHSPYKCSNMAGADVATFVMNEQQCLLSHEAYVVIVVCFTMLLVTLTLMTVVYRYHWHIRLLLYEAYRGERLARWRYRRAEDFQYDLFVCYDSEDSEWVLEQLVRVLEQQMGLRLCVHQSDYNPGKGELGNTEDRLEVSKRVLAVFSPSFAQSQWCHHELNLCLSHVVENDDVMVVVMLREVPARDITGAMAAVIKTTTYIEWADEPSFWRRMTLALRDVLPGVRH